MKKTVKLYMRQRCHLCEEAKVLLEGLRREFEFEIVEVDIDLDDDLVERYGISIPVIEVDGEEIMEGIIENEPLYKALTEKYNGFLS